MSCKIKYVVMKFNFDGSSHVFDSLSIDNEFTTQEAAEDAIVNYFDNIPKGFISESKNILFVLKLFNKE